ncbi:MAG: hypothetical protein U1E73_02230 [Planctomycetota bacterium]
MLDPRALLATSVWCLAAVHAVAQGDAAERQRITTAIDAWLASDQTSQELQDATVKIVLTDAKRGIDELGARLAKAPTDKGLKALATHVALEFLRREAEGKVVYAGRYAPLAPLQPYVGELFFGLLLDTPPWFPDTHRIRLVPALRDLQANAPDERRVEGIAGIVEDERREPKDLRTALACMLWQWGHKRYVQPELDRLVRESADGDPEQRLPQLQALADLWYRLREYKTAAAVYRSVEVLAEHAKIPLRPVDYYWAACFEALSGDVERGIAALARCAELQASPDTDSSHKVDPAVFELDPEIAALRRDPRFAAIVDKALGRSGKRRGQD